MNEIKCWWMKKPNPGNMGDIISPYLVKKLFNINCAWVDIRRIKSQHYIICGSILKKARDTSIVWGSGTMRENDKFNPNATYKMVRGPISYELLRAQNIPCNSNVFGDPALLSPLVFENKFNISYDHGIIPHYVDYKLVNNNFINKKKIKVINILNSNPFSVIKQMLKCKRIITSSLHGVIIAHAYGIPVSLVKFSDKLSGDGTKFKDHFSSVNLTMPEIPYIEKKDINHTLVNKLVYTSGATFNSTAMIKASGLDD